MTENYQKDETTVPGSQGERGVHHPLATMAANTDWGCITREVVASVQIPVPSSGDSGFTPPPTGEERFLININNFRLLRRAILELAGRMKQLKLH